MKGVTCFISAILVSVSSFPLSSNASEIYNLTIVNHFDKALSFLITINPQALPNLPKTFSIAQNNSLQTRILDIEKESYLHVDDKGKNNAFWGVEIKDQKLKFHGYLSKGLAYSWRDNQIVFCTPEEYQRNHSCFSN